MKRQDQQKQQHQFKIWGSTKELSNLFNKLTKPDYSSVEIRYLLDEYEKIENDLVDDVTQLLTETDNFLNATTLEPLFKESRDKALDQHEFTEIIHKMALAIQRIDKLCKEQPNKLAKEVLTSAADYAAECVYKRVNQLKVAHDKIYDLYNNGHLDVDLRDLVKTHHEHLTKP